MLRAFPAMLCVAAVLAGLALMGARTQAALNAWDASIAGTLVQVHSTAPVDGVVVKAFTPHGGTALSKAKSDSRGMFVLTGLRGGQYRIQFNKHGFHETAVVGLFVKPHTRLNLPGTVAMYPLGTAPPRLTGANDPCGFHPDSNETADAYIICSEH